MIFMIFSIDQAVLDPFVKGGCCNFDILSSFHLFCLHFVHKNISDFAKIDETKKPH